MEPNVFTDVVSGDGMSATGDVASRLLATGFNVNTLRTNAVLRKEEWELLDAALIEVARERLIGVADLLNAGLRFDIPNGLGTTRLEWETVSDMSPAEQNMSGITEGEEDRVLYGLAGIPLPITHKDFRINIRTLEASRTRGLPLDTTQASIAGELVSELIENTLFNGGFDSGANGTVYGYLTAPNRNTGTITADWASATGAQIVADVLASITTLQGDNMYGPYIIYVPYDAYIAMGDDFKTNSDKTIMQRVMEIDGITSVRPSVKMPAASALFVQMTRSVVDMIVGMQPTNLQWETMGGLIQHFKVMSIMVPRIKNDYSLQSGILHLS
jgi:uncharacterized linocin/CFP29 family protein